MYNKYRTQFEVIHTLGKEIGIPKPLIAQLKYDLRQRMEADAEHSFKAGRIVIPKEIRRTCNIREGDPLEIFLQDGGVVFKKYNPGYRDELANTLRNAADYYDDYEDDRAIAGQLRKIAQEIDALLA